MAMLVQTSEAPVKANKPHRKKAAPKRNGPWSTPGELSVDEWFELNSRDDGSRYELIDGSLIVSPAPPAQHQWIGDNLRLLLHTSLPEELAAITATGLLLDDKPGVIPDVIVVERQPFRDGAKLARPEWVRLVVEIVSRSTTATDRRLKPSKYAEAGIPHFWRIEMLPFQGQGNERLPIVFTYELDEDGGYRLVHRVAAGGVAELTEPCKLTLDPAGLARI
ncbi:Uma2 family endonuclease [Streptosporangium sp. NPDC048047]|uniref:Uma2 family endonuclease n=1 Tax=Streptosporangium sp. NPDC048047 TaxID=3155748 RepID=UPI0034361FA0